MDTYQLVHEYLHRLTPPRPAGLRDMERQARRSGFPIVGPLVGRVLYQLTLAVGARRIFEMGSGFGYSAYWFSLAAGADGHITLTDGNPENRDRALRMFAKLGLKSRFDFVVGDACETLRSARGPFDIIFNDIDKEDYPETIDIVAPRLRKGGLFITDNLLWDGRVLRADHDNTAAAVRRFTRQLYRDRRFFTTILPLRDGLALAVRL